MIQLLKQIIEIPSISGEENNVACLMTEVLTSHGYKVERHNNNIWTRCKGFDEKKPTILLDAHIDTVKPNGDWKTDPFTPTVIDGKLYGLGSNDTGGSIVSLLSTFLNIDTTKESYNLVFLSSAEEERAGVNGIRSIVDKIGKIDLAIIGEPTGMQAAIAERGLMVLDCLASGVSGHAAREEGENAIYKAMKDIDWFQNYTFPKISPVLGKIKMTVTGINAGTQHNVVPSECKFMVDCRINECYTLQEVLDIIKDNVESQVVPRSMTWHSSSISNEHPIVERCFDLGLRTYGSPTTSNQVAIPWTSLKIGPGESARSHTANEYIAISEIEQGIEIYSKLLKGLKLVVSDK